jgi:serine/threonine-protein kinase RsbT
LRVRIQIPVENAGDIVAARQNGRDLARQVGFSSTDATLIATAISELARNIVLYAKCGTISLEHADGRRPGLMITARDDGPGIGDVQRALIGGYTTSGGLGLGISGVRRIMDTINVESKIGKGTTVRAVKWL